MQILSHDFRKGYAKLRVNSLDDLWYLSQIIEAGDRVRAKTTRKIKLGEKEEAVKKTIILSIAVEKVEFHRYNNILRIAGKTNEEKEDIPKGSFHTISIDEESEFTLEKEDWPDYLIKRLKEAAEKKYQYLVCVFDREEGYFFLTKNYGYELLTKISGEPEKKEKRAAAKGQFYPEIIKLLGEYAVRFKPERIILASPAFYKEDLAKLVKEGELKKKIVLAVCSSVDESAVSEVMKRPELKETLKQSRFWEEINLVEELLIQINKKGMAAYGLKEVKKAVESGAVEKLLVIDSLIQKKKEEGRFEELNWLMRNTEKSKGEVHIISSEHEGGKKLNGLGGIGAILRFKLEW